MKIPYAGKEPVQHRGHTARMLTRSGQRDRNGRRMINIRFDDATYDEIASLARGRKISFAAQAREIIKLGLRACDGIER